MNLHSSRLRAFLSILSAVAITPMIVSACVADLDLGDHPESGEPAGAGPDGTGTGGDSTARGGDGGSTSGDAGQATPDGGNHVAPGDGAPPPEDAAPPPQDAALPPIVPNAKRVFETSTKFSGDLKTAGGGVDGVDGADKLCSTAAQAAALGGTWKAWISSSTANAFDRLTDVSPWYLVDRRTKVFDSKTGRLQGAVRVGPWANIDVNEFGVKNDLFGNTWTGTHIRAVPAPMTSGFTCNDWTSSRPINPYQGLTGVGISLDETYWSDGSTSACNNAHRLYCFEQ